MPSRAVCAPLFHCCYQEGLQLFHVLGRSLPLCEGRLVGRCGRDLVCPVRERVCHGHRLQRLHAAEVEGTGEDDDVRQRSGEVRLVLSKPPQPCVDRLRELVGLHVAGAFLGEELACLHEVVAFGIVEHVC